jgi:hypothetical protein
MQKYATTKKGLRLSLLRLSPFFGSLLTLAESSLELLKNQSLFATNFNSWLRAAPQPIYSASETFNWT